MIILLLQFHPKTNMKTIVVQLLTLLIFVKKCHQIYVSHDGYVQQEVEEQHVQRKKPFIAIVKQEFVQHPKGYQYSYETENGILAHETGFIKHAGDEKHETIVKQGSVTYHDEHGKPITLTYVADENGFQPQGDHLPTPPPIPEELRKALEEHEEDAVEHGYEEEEQGYQQEYQVNEQEHQIQRRY